MDQIDKINKINAYRKILETRRIPKFSPDDADAVVLQEINLEFDVWVKGQMSRLLGETKPIEKAPALPFNEEEIKILRVLIEGVKRRPAAPQRQPQHLTERPDIDAAPVSNRPRQQPPRQTRETVPSVNNRQQQQSRNTDDTGEDLARALDQMDSQGPNFD